MNKVQYLLIEFLKIKFIEFFLNIFTLTESLHLTFDQIVYIHFLLHISDLNYVEEIKGYTVSNHGRAQLVDQRNYTYNVHGKKANRIFWRCSKKHKKCKGRASTFENYIMKLSGIHNHEPNPNVVNKMVNYNVDPLKKDE